MLSEEDVTPEWDFINEECAVLAPLFTAVWSFVGDDVKESVSSLISQCEYHAALLDMLAYFYQVALPAEIVQLMEEWDRNGDDILDRHRKELRFYIKRQHELMGKPVSA